MGVGMNNHNKLAIKLLTSKNNFTKKQWIMESPSDI